MSRRSIIISLFLILSLGLVFSRGTKSVQAGQLDDLVNAYKYQPQGYPTGAEYAQPDTSVLYRWHFYRDDAIAKNEDAQMTTQSDEFNPIEDTGVLASDWQNVYGQVVYVSSHVTNGAKSAQISFSGATIQSGKATATIDCISGTKLGNSEQPHFMPCHSAQYRWLTFDVYSDAAQDVHVKIAKVPFVVHPGANKVKVKTTDIAGYRGELPASLNTVTFQVVSPAQNTTVYVDNFKVEQEVPSLIKQSGKLLQFATFAPPYYAAPVTFPGYSPVAYNDQYDSTKGYGYLSPVTTRQHTSLESLHSHENSLIWGRVIDIDSAVRVDVPNGRYGISIFATPAKATDFTTFDRAAGGKVTINGQQTTFLKAKTDSELRAIALSGETWDFRPGASVWEDLVHEVYYPKTENVFVTVTDGKLVFDFPKTIALRSIVIFPAGTTSDEQESVKELGRMNYLMSESWDIAHPWVKGDYANDNRYIGFHEEATDPSVIATKLAALNLSAADYSRGFKPFVRGLTEPVYPDSIPSAQEASVSELAAQATPGEHAETTLGLLPLATTKGIKITASDLTKSGGGTISSGQIDIRVARYQQKTMEFGHHNSAYNYQEGYLVKRSSIDLDPGVARRAYFDVTVQSGATPGDYAGTITITASGGGTLATMPLKVTVLPFTLLNPPKFFATDIDDPKLKDFGLNTVEATYDSAKANSYPAFALWPYDNDPPPFNGQKFGWGEFSQNKSLIQSIIDAGKNGTGPRPFFGGPPPGKQTVDPTDPFYAQVKQDFPTMDIVGVTQPTYYFQGVDAVPSAAGGYVWMNQIKTKGQPNLLNDAITSGKEFWFADRIRAGKEQTARFTSGFWLWRSGAFGRAMTFKTGGDYIYGTAAEAGFPSEPYYTALGIVSSGTVAPFKDSLTQGEVNPSRDLVLLREGINDYRYIYTLDTMIKQAEAKGLTTQAITDAKKTRDDLFSSISLDLTTYYEARNGFYSENWYPLANNPWTGDKFDTTRKNIATNASALKQLLGDSPYITLDKQVSSSTAVSGDTLTYTITYKNIGTKTATNVVITDAIPAGSTYEANSASNSGTLANGKLSWTIGSVAPNAQGSLTFRAKVQ